MKNQKVRKIQQQESKNIGRNIFIAILFLLIIIGVTKKTNKKSQQPLSTNSATSTAVATSTTTRGSSLGDFLTKQTEKLANQQAVALVASGTTNVINTLKKSAPQKTYTGQEAVDFIKTLPIETQKQIVEGSH